MKTERKILVSIGLISLLLIGATIYNSINVTSIRTISGSTDDSYTKIRCGNGNIYAVSVANLVTALALGTEVILPPCNLTITSTLDIVSHTVLRGAGPSQTILFMANAGNRDMITVDGVHNVEIRGICFDMNNASQTSHSAYSIIEITNSEYITIDNCILKHGTTGNMIGCDDDCSYIDVLNSIFDHREWYLGTGHYGAGVRFNSNYNSVRNCRFYDLMGAAIYEEHDTVAGQIPSAYNIIDGNYITGYGTIGVAIEGWGGSGDGPKAGMTIISNNIVKDLDGITAAVGPGGGYGLQYPRAFNVCNNCTLTGNIINNVYTGIGVVSGASKRVFGVVITGNVIGNIGKWGINIEYASFCTVIGNSLRNPTAGAIDGIQIYEANNNTIQGNVISGFNVGISEESNSNWNIILGNTVNCSTDIDKLGASTVCEHNIGTVS